MSSLYDLGFRQGMVLESSIAVPLAGWDGAQLTWTDSTPSTRWLIATQDCDLSQLTDGSPEQVELRPVYDGVGNEPSGIRSRYFALPHGRRLDGKGPRYMVPAGFIASLGLGDPLPDERLVALKLWLGRRYDRPAVPRELVPLMQAISKALIKNAGRRGALAEVRDVFVAIDETSEPPRFALTAITSGAADQALVERTLTEAALDIAPALGTLVDAAALLVTEAAVDLLESAYVADVSDASIGRELTGAPPF